MKCRERLADYFQANGVSYLLRTHPTAYTTQEVAAAQHVSGKHVAKVVIVRADEARNSMLVLSASAHIDFQKLRGVVGAKAVRLATEDEFGGIFPDCDLGAMPPFGNLYGLPVYVEPALAKEPRIIFQIGTHRDTVEISYADFARLALPVIADLAATQATKEEAG
jgi:Ala-tRNA(Pro) deacylase